MGSGNVKSKIDLDDLDSPIYKEMKKKYGKRIMEVIPEWVENHGFPKRGTFSITALNRVKESLEKCENKLRDKKKLKNKQKDKFQKHRKYLDYWVEEAERREKRQTSKELPFGNE